MGVQEGRFRAVPSVVPLAAKEWRNQIYLLFGKKK